ncbi:FecR family protein [Paraflavitalea soli]|uniref:FecR family protein n=1 Tax=Paraflavitalea soli TaxID=2315862 RepID=A0A3B7MH36_9BACT|nr:FecR family protein [Paraflavitalea soli]AXY73702.1 FecR family protein [Paraflavitalea soli]
MIRQHEILVKLSRREATAEEQEVFRQWLQTLSPGQLEAVLDEYGNIIADMPEVREVHNPELLTAIHAAIDHEPTRRILPMRWIWAAAAVLLLAVSLIVLQTNTATRSTKSTQQVADLPPGKSGAILTLTNGTQLVLDSLGNGIIARDGGSETVLHDGKLIYNVRSNNSQEIGFNEMTTPKGRNFRVELPDGTVVWLNAASSIRYPTAFTGDKREVTIKGEAYFEVMKNARMPFVVHVDNRADIEVLGTHFNVEAYDNMATIKTTLLEGSVKVGSRPRQESGAAGNTASQQSAILKPGQQAQVEEGVQVVNNIDTSKVMAWKNGLFNFEDATLKEVMKQLERWYDIEVVYEKGVPDIVFGGEMTKNISLAGLLLILEKSDIHFRLEGRTLVVLP